MTTELSTRERVQQAVTYQFELLAQVEQARAVENAARSARSDAVKNTVVDLAKEQASLVKQDAADSADEAYQRLVSAAQAPLQRAQIKYDTAKEKAVAARVHAVSGAEEFYTKTVAEAQREYDMTLATAEADVHRAKQEADSIQGTIVQNQQVVKDTLNIDISKLLV